MPKYWALYWKMSTLKRRCTESTADTESMENTADTIKIITTVIQNINIREVLIHPIQKSSDKSVIE